jgi:hypothetical protein
VPASRHPPRHTGSQDLAERLSARCETDVAVYVALDRFLEEVGSLSRAVFVEPLVLYDNSEFAMYLAAKAALMHLPHEVLRLPYNVTAGPQLVVMQDLLSLASASASVTAGLAADSF